MTVHYDLVAVRRAFMRGGHVAGIIELCRRWPGISERSAAILISIILTIDANESR